MLLGLAFPNSGKRSVGEKKSKSVAVMSVVMGEEEEEEKGEEEDDDDDEEIEGDNNKENDCSNVYEFRGQSARDYASFN